MPDQYHVGSGFSDEELALASWWVRHGFVLKRIGYGFLIGLGACLWTYTIWSLLDGYIISEPRESRIVQHMLQTTLTPEAFTHATPQPLLPSDTTVLQNTDNRQDIIVELSNSNLQWWAEFDYRFEMGGELSATRTGYILPESQRYLTELGWKGTSAVTNPQLLIDHVRWHRVRPEEVEKNYIAFRDKRLQLSFGEVTYKKDLTIGDQQVGQTTFVLHNPTGYGFWSADITIILYRLDNKVAFTTINVKDIKPGETRPMSINWFDNLTGISKTEIRADVNVLEKASFLPGQRF